MNHMIESACEWMFPIQAALGIGGNILNLMVLLSRPMRSRTNTLLAFAAVSDVLFLLAMVPHNMARWPSITYVDCTDLSKRLCYSDFTEFYIEQKMHFTFLANWFSAASSWLMVAVSFDRLWAIKSPFSARSTSCSVRELVVIAIIFISTGALAVHMNFSFTVTENSGIREMISTQSSELATVLTVLDIMFFVFIPVFLLITLNSFLVYYLRNRRQFFEPSGIFREGAIHRLTKSSDANPSLLEQNNFRSDTLSGPTMVTRNFSSSSASMWCRQLNKAERHVTVTVVVIVSAYVITHLPSALLYANMNIFHLNEMYKNQNSYTWVAVSCFIVISGKVANYFLFCLSSKHFRSQMRKKLMCVCWRRDPYSYKDSLNRPRTRSLPLNQIGDSTNNIPNH